MKIIKRFVKENGAEFDRYIVFTIDDNGAKKWLASFSDEIDADNYIDQLDNNSK